MKAYKIPHTDLVVSRIAYGCGMLANWDQEPLGAETIAKAVRLINTAYDNGITLFDHADLYCFGKAEAVFGEVLKRSPGLREKIIIQSKCGQKFPDGWKIGDGIHVDLGREYIIRAAEGSLKRLGSDSLDILLLHVPDALVELEEIAQAFDALKRSGKVRYFGVSNYTAAQIAGLQKYLSHKLVANQVQLGLAHPHLIADGMEFTLELIRGALKKHAYAGYSGTGTLDYCRLHDIQIQAWSPLRGDLLNPSLDAAPEVKQTAQMLADLAKEKNTTASAIGLAWLLNHGAGIVPIIGTTNPKHLIENCMADRVTLSRDEWYALFASAARIDARKIAST